MTEPFTHRLRVRYVECDQLGVVFNAHYLSYLDQSITELFRAAVGGYGRLLAEGLDLVVAEVTLRFFAPARFDDELDLEVVVDHLGTTSLLTTHRVRRDGELLTEAGMRHVWVDRTSAQKAPIPDWARAGLSNWLVAAEAG